MQTAYPAILILLSGLLWWAPGVRALDLNTSHPLTRNLLGWWLVHPETAGGTQWWNVLPRWPLTLTNMGTGAGWARTARQGWTGEMRFDGTGDYAVGDTDTRLDFGDTTFTVFARFRSTAPTGRQYMVTKGQTASGGGWLFRLSETGQVLARLLDASATKAFERVSASTDNTAGAWKSAMAVFTTSTTVPATNTITLYVNGVVDHGTAVTPSGLAYAPCGGCRFMIGAPHDDVQWFAGALDDIRIWTRGLSAAEALAVHQQTPPLFGGMVEGLPVVLGATGAAAAAGVTPRRVTHQ